MGQSVDELLKELTLEEKCSLLSGETFNDSQSIPRLGIEKMLMTDGPHGLRKQSDKPDHLGMNVSVPATCFPPACALGSSWNREIVYKMGEALASECRAENVAVILGPGNNIKRSPLCGRNFEYFSEDPYLASNLAAQHIKGVQSKGVGASLKHFAVNNQETKRLTLNATVDERTLREIYLTSFETAVKEGIQTVAKPTIMATTKAVITLITGGISSLKTSSGISFNPSVAGLIVSNGISQ